MFGLQIEACADGIVYEKIESNDSFYLSHQKECKEDRRGYTVSKEIACYKSPEGKKLKTIITKRFAYYRVLYLSDKVSELGTALLGY